MIPLEKNLVDSKSVVLKFAKYLDFSFIFHIFRKNGNQLEETFVYDL
jgi:hypothetical protein